MTQPQQGTSPSTPNPRLTSSTDPLIGVTLEDRYTIRKMIGRGGMGLVYLATQSETPHEVVVKVLAPHWLSQDDAVKRFDREADSLRSLAHPNIVDMIDFGRQDGRGYLVMEYLQGEPLNKYLARRGRLRLKEFVPIAAQILKGTGYAHSREVIVRDIKPANVMLCERKGRANFVKMLDFGLAKLVNDDNLITKDCTIGTVGYIAPETISGKKPDLQVDVYALGVLFYYMLSGQLPLQADESNSAATLYKTVNEAPQPMGEVLPPGHDIPEGLIDLVHRCLLKDPGQRPLDANQLVEQMIDVVPASTFRLPSAARPKLGPVQAGNTGMHELIEGALARKTDRDSVVMTAGEADVTEQEAHPAAVTVEVYNRGRRLALTAGLLIGGIGVGVGAVFATIQGLSDDGPTLQPTAATPIEASVVATPAGAPTQAEPKAAVAETAAVPTAAVLDAQTKTPAKGLGPLALTSEPSHAQVVLDGKTVGVTPYTGKVAVGTHTLAVVSRGYYLWSSEIDVTPSDADTISVELVRKTAGTKRRSRRGSRRSAAAEPVAVQPVAQVEPAEPVVPEPPKKQSSSKSPLVAGSQAGGGSSLLKSGDDGKRSGVLLKGQ